MFEEPIETWLVDQIMRGPGRSRGGGDTDRLNKPCPEALAEFQFCERFGFRILPRDLVPGVIDDQPFDTYMLYANLLGTEARLRERLEVIQQRKQSPRKGRR